jgi:hypothetical protein
MLFASYIIMHITNPMEYVNKLHELISEFNKVAEQKVNIKVPI